jgi:hypothetical protein
LLDQNTDEGEISNDWCSKRNSLKRKQ